MKATIEELKAGVVRGIERSIPDLVAASPVDTGQYANSWAFTYDEKRALVGNTAPHAPIIEDGARPFTPPLGPLLAWAKRVLQDPSQPPDYSEEVRSLAWGVRGKIMKFGMEPKHIMGNMVDTIIENIRLELLAL
jgi:hypothetical protein